MRNVDAFTSQLVDFVRRMPDDALLALVRAQLGAAASAAAPLPQVRAQVAAAVTPPAPVRAAAPARTAPAPRTPARPAAKKVQKRSGTKVAVAKAPRGAAAKKGAGRRSAGRGRGSAAGRQELLSSVERIVKGSSGVSASEVAKSAGVPQSRASSALKELKLAKRIYQGGDRRFARYAGDGKTAQGASDNARKSASGPVVKKKR